MRTSLTDSSDGVSQYVKNVKTQRFQEDLQVSSGGSSQQAALLNSHELTICLALQLLQPSISPRAAIARPGSNKFPWVPWGAMGCHGVPWGAMGCHGVPWGAPVALENRSQAALIFISNVFEQEIGVFQKFFETHPHRRPWRGLEEIPSRSNYWDSETDSDPLASGLRFSCPLVMVAVAAKGLLFKHHCTQATARGSDCKQCQPWFSQVRKAAEAASR